MGLHELSLGLGGTKLALPTGLYASTKVQTAFCWQSAGDLRPGDLVMTLDDGLVPLHATRTEIRRALWSVHLPANAHGNLFDMLLPPGQSVLVQTDYAMPFSGDDLALVPATALEGLSGITARVPAIDEPIVQLQLPRFGILLAGPGLMVGCPGCDAGRFDLKDLMHAPTRPVLPIAAARQMVATLIAEEAGHGFKAHYAADLRAPPNLS